MNLRNIYVMCKNNYSAIKNIQGNEITINSRHGIKITDWIVARDVLMELRTVNSLKIEVDSLIEEVPAVYRNKNEFVVDRNEWTDISNAKNRLIRTMEDTMDLYEKMGLNTEERIGIDIKLPKYRDFSEFVQYVNDLEMIFTKCPFLQAENEELVFDNVDVGSTWLSFVVAANIAIVGGSVLLNNIAAFVDKCIILRSHYLTLKKQKAQLEADERTEAEKETIRKYLEDMYKLQVDAAIKELEETTGHKVENKDGDENGRINLCMEKMGALIDLGLQIHSSIDSPKETQVLFEPLEMKYSQISDSLKLLEKKSDKVDE